MRNRQTWWAGLAAVLGIGVLVGVVGVLDDDAGTTTTTTTTTTTATRTSTVQSPARPRTAPIDLPDTPDEKFLHPLPRTVRYARSDPELTALGREICRRYATSPEPPQITRAAVTASLTDLGFTPQESSALILAATVAYCPQR